MNERSKLTYLDNCIAITGCVASGKSTLIRELQAKLKEYNRNGFDGIPQLLDPLSFTTNVKEVIKLSTGIEGANFKPEVMSAKQTAIFASAETCGYYLEELCGSRDRIKEGFDVACIERLPVDVAAFSVMHGLMDLKEMEGKTKLEPTIYEYRNGILPRFVLPKVIINLVADWKECWEMFIKRAKEYIYLDQLQFKELEEARLLLYTNFERSKHVKVINIPALCSDTLNLALEAFLDNFGPLSTQKWMEDDGFKSLLSAFPDKDVNSLMESRENMKMLFMSDTYMDCYDYVHSKVQRSFNEECINYGTLLLFHGQECPPSPASQPPPEKKHSSNQAVCPHCHALLTIKKTCIS